MADPKDDFWESLVRLYEQPDTSLLAATRDIIVADKTYTAKQLREQGWDVPAETPDDWWVLKQNVVIEGENLTLLKPFSPPIDTGAPRGELSNQGTDPVRGPGRE